jgi:hypothetical protein
MKFHKGDCLIYDGHLYKISGPVTGDIFTAKPLINGHFNSICYCRSCRLQFKIRKLSKEEVNKFLIGLL